MNKNIFEQNIRLIDKINFFLACLVVFIMPFGIHVTNLAIVLWLFTWLLQLDKERFKIKLQKNEKIILLIILIFYLLNIIGFFYSTDKKEALRIIELKSYIFIFPIVFLTVSNLYRKYYRQILLSFVSGNFFASMSLLVIATIHSLHLENGHLIFNVATEGNFSFWSSVFNGGNNFMYASFSIFHHPTYSSVFVIFSIVILLFLYKNRNNTKDNFIDKILSIKILIFFIIIFFTIIVFLLSSKACLITISIVYIIYFLSSKIKFKYIYLTLFILIVSVIVVKNPRINIFYSYILGTKKTTEISTGIKRIGIWKSAIKVIAKHPIIGVGTGDATDELIKEYAKENIIAFEKLKYNAHDEYLETLLRYGSIGFCLFILIFIYGTIIGIKNKNTLLLSFFIILGINFLFETMLDRIAGIDFFAFFLNFLLFIKEEKNGNDFLEKNK